MTTIHNDTQIWAPRANGGGNVLIYKGPSTKVPSLKDQINLAQTAEASKGFIDGLERAVLATDREAQRRLLISQERDVVLGNNSAWRESMNAALTPSNQVEDKARRRPDRRDSVTNASLWETGDRREDVMGWTELEELHQPVKHSPDNNDRRLDWASVVGSLDRGSSDAGPIAIDHGDLHRSGTRTITRPHEPPYDADDIANAYINRDQPNEDSHGHGPSNPDEGRIGD